MTTATPQVDMPLRGRAALVALGGDIKVSHSVFALPFALLAGTLAAVAEAGTYGRTWGVITFVLIGVCMVTARTAAMASNRLLDRDLDALNPRTRGRALPAGRLGAGYVAFTVFISSTFFIAACAAFWWFYGNTWPLALGPFVLAFLCAYPLLKRFTSLCHYYLGVALALAPVCAWVAVRGDLSATPVLLALAVLFWTAGFDVIYATVDASNDRETGVHSVPARFGVRRALFISRASHVTAVTFLVAAGVTSVHLGALWYAAVTAVAGLLVYEHRLVTPDDLSKVNVAFFTVNGVISLILGTCGVIDALT